MSVTATTKSVRISPQKLRLAAKAMKGVSIERAIDILQFSPLKASKMLLKTLMSAIANAENNAGLDVDELIIKTVYVDEGRTLKRQRARARGRSARIFKRTSHVTVVVDENL